MFKMLMIWYTESVSMVRAPYLPRNTKRTDLNDWLKNVVEDE
jgi:hypothetical protein